MIQILNIAPNVIAYRIEGTVERSDIEGAFAEVDEKLAREDGLRVYVELHSLKGMTWDALWRDLQLGLQRLNLFPRLEKAVLVSDMGWLGSAASVPDRLFPGLEVRAFPLVEIAQARAWVQE